MGGRETTGIEKRKQLAHSSETCNNHDKGLSNIHQVRNGLLSRGWCCHHVDYLLERYDPRTFGAFLSLERSARRLVNHETCRTEERCIAFNTDARAYQTLHKSADCDCSNLRVSCADIRRIIRRGEIPLISITQNQVRNTVLDMQVHSRSARSRYIAISHVWVDGLGNPSANALPKCQIKRLWKNLLAIREAMGHSTQVSLETVFVA